MQKKITYQEADIFYGDHGQGQAVVLLHGFAEDQYIWDNIISAISGYRFIVPDLPGSGTSGPIHSFNMEAIAETVARIMELENIEKPIVIGHSMGGYITLAFAEKYPHLLRAFGLFHSSAFADSEDKKITRKKNINFIRTQGSSAFLKQSMPGLFSDKFKENHLQVVEALIDKYKDFNSDSLAAYTEAMMNRPDRKDTLITASLPILFIIGKHDNAIPFDDSLQLCHLPSLSYIHILGNTGHMGMLEEPDHCINIVKNFLKDVTVSP